MTLRDLLVKAKKERYWLYHIKWNLWFSPRELEESVNADRSWLEDPADVWELRHPIFRLRQLQIETDRATKELNSFRTRYKT